MNVESIEIPAERLQPVAADASSAGKAWAAGVLFFGAIFLIIAFAGPPPDGSGDDRTTTIIGGLMFVSLFGHLGYRFARNATRASRAGQLAKSDPRYTFRLSGKYVITADEHGAPHPNLSFKVNRKLRTMLLAVPRASVVDPR